MARPLHSYADTAGFDAKALRRIARDGVPGERVFACWALMVRGQGIAVDPAAGPDPGVRRLLLLNLAVGKDIDLLERLAVLDPDPTIRREATLWVWRVAPERGLQCIRARILGETDEATLLDMLADLPPEPWAELVQELDAPRGRSVEVDAKHADGFLSFWNRFIARRPAPTGATAHDAQPTPVAAPRQALVPVPRQGSTPDPLRVQRPDPAPIPAASAPTVPWDPRNAPRPRPDFGDPYLRRLYLGWCANWSRRCHEWCEQLARTRPGEPLRSHTRCERCGFRHAVWTTNFSMRSSADVYNRGTCCNPDCRHAWYELM